VTVNEFENEGFDQAAPPVGARPAFAQFRDRLLLIRPTAIERNVPNDLQPGTFKDRVTADVVFLDGDTITDKIDDDGAHPELDEPIRPGDIMEDYWISQTLIVRQIKGKIGATVNPWVLGRLTKLPPRQKGRKGAWSLAEFTPDDAKRAASWMRAQSKKEAERAKAPAKVEDDPWG
jgi:hypothetical protein